MRRPGERVLLWASTVGVGALSVVAVAGVAVPSDGGSSTGAPVAASSVPAEPAGSVAVSGAVTPVVAVVPAPVVRAEAPTCEPDASPRFGDPAHPNRITNKTCGYVDASVRTRSADPWIDAQLVDRPGTHG